MSQQASARNTQAISEVLLTVLSGPEAGVAYKLVGQTITLGRAPENDVILQDNKSSRNHACIERRGADYWIKDLESTAGVFVNGQQVREKILTLGDELIVGATELRFGSPQALSLVNAAPPHPNVTMNAQSPAGHLPLTRNANLGAADPQAAGWLPPLSKKTLSPQGDQKIFGIFLAVGAVIVALTLLKSTSTKLRQQKIKDDAALEQEITEMGENNEKRQEEIIAKGKDTQQYSEAQAFYLRGFREFESANYGRAIQNFEAALALFPSHPLAKHYLEKSRLKNNELVTQALNRGEKDFQLERFSNAFNEYRTVILITADPNNKSYQLAQKGLKPLI